jgi:D-alanine-D-alanine ligase-like ATP-grasp enzyme
LTKYIYKYFSTEGLKKSKSVSNSSRLIIREADRYGVDWKIVPGTQIVTLTYKGQEKSYYHQIPTTTTALAVYATKNKKITSNLLQQAGIEVPKGFRIRKDSSNEYLTDVYNNLNKPLVVKPTDGTWGENISLNITTPDQYFDAVDFAFEYSIKKKRGVIVEEMFDGTEYRVLCTREKVIGVLKRVPANVIGNGKNTIRKLIKLKNEEEIRGVKGSDKSHLKIIMDKRLKGYLTEQSLSLDSVPNKDQRVFLRKVSNVSQGGDAYDYTDKVHPSVKKIALKAINTIPGLAFAGIDFMSSDITKKQTKDSYVIIEINDSPGFDIHDMPYQGKNRRAAREFLFLIFPELRKVKIK